MLIDPPDTAAARGTPGARFRAALAACRPLPVIGGAELQARALAQRAGHRAIYIGGGALATYGFGLPDLGITTLTELLGEVRRQTDACDLPLMVDVDTGFGGMFSIARLVKGLIKDGAAAMHMEDQVAVKRCGHRPNKAVVPTAEMVDRLKAALDARTDPDFFIVARTDALAVEGMDATLARAVAYQEAGADMIFAEACRTLDDYRAFVRVLGSGRVLANVTEFSLTPSFTLAQLHEAGVAAALYPQSAARAMSYAAQPAYEAILRDGSTLPVQDRMQHRDDFYAAMNYYEYERKVDELYAAPGR